MLLNCLRQGLQAFFPDLVLLQIYGLDVDVGREGRRYLRRESAAQLVSGEVEALDSESFYLQPLRVAQAQLPPEDVFQRALGVDHLADLVLVAVFEFVALQVNQLEGLYVL